MNVRTYREGMFLVVLYGFAPELMYQNGVGGIFGLALSVLVA